MAPNFTKVKVFGQGRREIEPPVPLNTALEVDLETGSFLSNRPSTTPDVNSRQAGDNPYLDEYRA